MVTCRSVFLIFAPGGGREEFFVSPQMYVFRKKSKHSNNHTPSPHPNSLFLFTNNKAFRVECLPKSVPKSGRALK